MSLSQIQLALRWIEQRDVTFISGVPCSWLTPLLDHICQDATITYLPAANEALAVAHAAGAALCGHRPLVICQNSGVGYLVNPITSLLLPYGLSCDFIISNRIGTSTEPQHAFMETATIKILSAVGITLEGINDPPSRTATLRALLIESKISTTAFPSVCLENNPSLSRHAYLEKIIEKSKNQFVLTSTGFNSREMCALYDNEKNFYMMGSMGCTAATGLIVAMNTQELVYIVDGDGALLMHLGELATIGGSGPKNLCHIVFNNGLYESTGKNPSKLNFGFAADTAIALGYSASAKVSSLEQMESSLQYFIKHGGPYLIECKTIPAGVPPRVEISPSKIAMRFKNALAER